MAHFGSKIENPASESTEVGHTHSPRDGSYPPLPGGLPLSDPEYVAWNLPVQPAYTTPCPGNGQPD